MPLEKAGGHGISAWLRIGAGQEQHTLEDAEKLELCVDIGLLLLQVNRTCTLSVNCRAVKLVVRLAYG